MCTCYPPSLPEILSLVFLQAIVLPQYLAPWSYFYNRPGTVDLDIPMLNDFVVGTSRATAKIALGRRDHWKTLGEGHGRELAVLSGSIRGVVIYHGIRCAFLRDACYTTETGTDICRAQCVLPSDSVRMSCDRGMASRSGNLAGSPWLYSCQFSHQDIPM